MEDCTACFVELHGNDEDDGDDGDGIAAQDADVLVNGCVGCGPMVVN